MGWRAILLGLCLMTTGCTAFQGAGGQGGCASGGNSVSCGAQLANKDGTESYTFNSGDGRVSLQWGGQVGSGSLTITLLDSAGATAYTHTISGSGQGGFSDTAEGASGQWTLRLDYDGFTGQVGFSVEG